MKADELREKYIKFFKERGHKEIPSASLIPENDPSVLFTTAGMHPLVPYLMGEKHPEGKRLVNVQKCIRTVDIEEVGNEIHHTFFEMLGNWSLGSYWKEEAIKMSFEFLTKELNLPLEKLAFSVFKGDEDAPFDKEAYDKWISLGVNEKKIAKLDKKDNWWGPAGETGPCGPDSEMFYWTGEGIPEKFDTEDKRWVEIWNDVFMQYNKTSEGKYESLEQKNVDTGMGLERTLAVLNGESDNYKTELWQPLIKKIEELSGKNYEEHKKEMRIIADHIKASGMILGDEKGIVPSNTGQGYVLRRLIRRAVRYAKILGMEEGFTNELAEISIHMYRDVYRDLKNNESFIKSELKKEEEKFSKTLEKGEKEFNKMYKDGNLSGREAFVLFSTYGYPFELIEELVKEKGDVLSKDEFEKEMKKHSELSKTASAGMFKGGLSDDGEETKKLHTTAHLMLEALRRVLGDHVSQKGSNITSERLRFDFSHPEKMTEDQKTEVEKIVNEQISKKLPVSFEEMTLEEAKKIGATGAFEHKYGDKVKVYSIGDFSKEICGGPHVSNTFELGTFKIKKEESVSAGVRRIKGILKLK